MKKRKFRLELLFLLPSLVGVIVFYFLPFCNVLLRSFHSDFGNEFVRLDNYVAVIQNKAFKIAMTNTLNYVIIYIPVLLFFSLLITLLMDYTNRHKKVLKRIFLLPMAIPVTSLVLVWKIIFSENGLLNSILIHFNIQGPDYFNSSFAFIVLGITYIWRNFGYDMILWQTGIEGIEAEQYEAASLDGAGYLRRVLYIIMPQIKEMGFVIVIISLLNSFKVFREAYLIAGDYPNPSIYMIQHLFNNWFVNLELGKLAAGSVMIAIMVMLFVTALNNVFFSREKRRP